MCVEPPAEWKIKAIQNQKFRDQAVRMQEAHKASANKENGPQRGWGKTSKDWERAEQEEGITG